MANFLIFKDFVPYRDMGKETTEYLTISDFLRPASQPGRIASSKSQTVRPEASYGDGKT